MIVNSSLLKLKNREAENIKKVQEVLLGMKGRIDVLLDMQAELNIRPSQTAYDIILITKFASIEDINAYLAHPIHQEVAKFIGNALDIQASVCYEI
jgi:hypothetical protein